MASFVYPSFLTDVFNGNCNTTHNYKALLTGTGYAENAAHTKRSNITSEISASGYPSGGVAVTLSITFDVATNSHVLTVGPATFPAMTGSARKLVVYRFRNGTATADELVAINDKGNDISFTTIGLVWPASTWRIPLPAPV